MEGIYGYVQLVIAGGSEVILVGDNDGPERGKGATGDIEYGGFLVVCGADIVIFCLLLLSLESRMMISWWWWLMILGFCFL